MSAEPLSAAVIISRFTVWEHAASQSPNPQVAGGSPLPAPTQEEAQELAERWPSFRRALDMLDGLDWHGRPVFGGPDELALGWLWEAWRDGKLGVLNGYRDVWTVRGDALYDTPKDWP